MNNVEELQAQYTELTRVASRINLAADEFRRDLEREARDRITKDVEERYGEAVRSANIRVYEARKALDAAKEVQAKTCLTDERIYVEWTTSGRYWDRTPRPGRRGKLEIFTRESAVPGNLATYSQPCPGDIVMRVLKKDGTPSSRFERNGWNPDSSRRTWYPEGEKPSQQE